MPPVVRRLVLDAPVPVTVLTGFLGAGKTTLLNRLVARTDGPRRRFAVIVNESGDVALDGQLVVGSPEEIVELRDGCVCCTVRGDLSSAVARLLDRRKAWFRRLSFDHVLVECSGLASPGPVVQTFLLDRRLAQETRMDGVVAVASAVDLPRHLAELPQAAEQLGYADHVVLAHCDRVEDAAPAEARIAAINPSAPVTRSPGPLPDLLALGSQEPERWRFGHAHGDAGGVTHVSLRSDHALDLGRLKLFLQFVAARRTWTLLRLKGIFRCEGQARAVVAHGVYQWLELGPGTMAPPPVSQLLLIGRDLDEAEIRRGWAAAGG